MSPESAAPDVKNPGPQEQIDALMAANKLPEAEQATRDALAGNPGALGLIRRMVDILFRQKRLDEAREWSDRAVAAGSHHGWVYFQRATVLTAADDIGGAYDALSEALRLEPANVMGMLRLSDLCLQRNEEDEAKEWIERAIEVSPDNPHAYARLSQLLRTQKDLPAAEEALRTAVEKDPTIAANLLRLADFYVERSDYTGALELADKAVAINPRNPHPYARRAGIYLAQGDLAQAEEGFRMAVELQPDLTGYEKRRAEIAARRQAAPEPEIAEAEASPEPELAQAEAEPEIREARVEPDLVGEEVTGTELVEDEVKEPETEISPPELEPVDEIEEAPQRESIPPKKAGFWKRLFKR